MTVFTEDIGRRRLLYRLAIARSDIRAAHEIAKYGNEHVPEINALWIPLQDALVVAYARPFTSNKPFGPLASSWGKFTDKRNQALHRELIEMRHQLVAHTDARQRSVIIFPPNALPPAPGMSPAPDATLVVTQKRPVPGYFAAVAQHCNDLLARLHEAVENELQGLFGSIGSIPPFDLLTGEERRPQMNAEIVSEGQIPRLPK